MTKKTLSKYYIFRLLNAFTFAMPFWVLWLTENGLSLTEVMLLEAFYVLALLLLNIPAGAFADRFGRKTSLLLSTFLLIIAFVGYGMSTLFFHFLIVEFLFGISIALWKGPDSAFLYDTLYEMGNTELYSAKEGFVNFVTNMGWAVGAIIGGFIAAAYGISYVFFFSVIPILVSLIPLYLMKEPRVYKMTTNYWTQITTSVKYAAKHPSIRFFLIYAGILNSSGFAIFLFYQPYLELLQTPLVFFGLAFFLNGLGSGLGSLFSARLEKILGEKQSLFFIPSLSIIFIVLLGFNHNIIVAFVLIALISLLGGFAYPLLLNYINIHTPSSQRATTISLYHFIGSAFFVVLAPLYGYIADNSLRGVYFTIALVVTIMLFLLIFS